ncbi:MAG: helix-turn-helix domain-containing protein [Solirubrobacteraceae bacterium]
MNSDRDVRITLTDEQVRQVVGDASGGARMTRLLPELSDLDELRRIVLPRLDDERCSRSTFRALLVLAAFPADGSEREMSDVARTLDLSPSMTHRYIGTWMAVGLLEQDPRSRRYRRALASGTSRQLAAPPRGGGDAS